jgi:hypothetical protein
MQVKVSVTTTVTTDGGTLLTEVTTVERVGIGDNSALLRDAVRTSDVYGKAISLNLDQVEARFSRG